MYLRSHQPPSQSAGPSAHLPSRFCLDLLFTKAKKISTLVSILQHPNSGTKRGNNTDNTSSNLSGSGTLWILVSWWWGRDSVVLLSAAGATSSGSQRCGGSSGSSWCGAGGGGGGWEVGVNVDLDGLADLGSETDGCITVLVGGAGLGDAAADVFDEFLVGADALGVHSAVGTHEKLASTILSAGWETLQTLGGDESGTGNEEDGRELHCECG